jgi:hypothetical protein
VGMWWLSWGCGGSVGMWWLRGDVMAQWGCGGSVGDVVAQRGCGGSLGDVVAQLAKCQSYTRLQRSSSEFDPGIPHSLLRGQKKWLCTINKISGCEASIPEFKKKLLSFLNKGVQ